MTTAACMHFIVPGPSFDMQGQSRTQLRPA